MDVRSTPYSEHFKEFNREELESKIRGYIYMGDKLGGKIVKEAALKGISKIEDLLDQSPVFKEGMRELYKICKDSEKCLIMRAEKDPLNCHRFLAIGYLFIKRAKDVVGNRLKGKKDYKYLTEKSLIKGLKELYEEDEEKVSAAINKQRKLFEVEE